MRATPARASPWSRVRSRTSRRRPPGRPVSIVAQVQAIQESVDRASREIGGIAEVVSQINDYQTTVAGAVEEQTATTRGDGRDGGRGGRRRAGRRASPWSRSTTATAASAAGLVEVRNAAMDLERAAPQQLLGTAGRRWSS